MKSKNDLSKFKKVSADRVDPEASRVVVNMRVDAGDIALLRYEADRLGIPYQTLIGSIIHRFVNGDLVDKKDVQMKMIG